MGLYETYRINGEPSAFLTISTVGAFLLSAPDVAFSLDIVASEVV